MAVMLGSASRRLGRYELVSYLGSGGMSDVYVALHTGLRKRFALKLLRASLREDSEAVRRFLREGECAARVCHPNVVDVSDVGMESGVPYLVMELLQGETLAQLLAREGALSVDRAVDLLLPILDAVSTAHAAGVLHRDIKPANILLARSADGSVKPKLVDFGIAQLREQQTLDECENGPIGTPHYMSPEQARAERVDERSDQYSIGSVLFEMLTGREPYRGETVDEVLAQVARGNFPMLVDVSVPLPPRFGSVLERATARCPAHRFSSLSDLAYALVPFASPRTRKLWVSREEREGVCSAQLLSGAYRPLLEEPKHAPTVLRASIGPRATRARRRALRTSLRLVAGSLLLGLGLLAGLRVTPDEVEGARIAQSSPTAEFVEAPAAGTEHPTSAENSESAPLTSAPVQSGKLVRLVPNDALVLLDGAPLGRGAFAPPSAVERVRELRVVAKGYVDQVLLFRGALPENAIVLERRRRKLGASVP